MISEIERRLCVAGYVSIRVVCLVSEQKRQYVHKLITAHGIEFKTYKHGKFPKWTELRKVLPLADDILHLPAESAELLPYYDSPTTEGTGERIWTLPPLIPPKSRAKRVKR